MTKSRDELPDKKLTEATPEELCIALLIWTDKKGNHLTDDWMLSELCIEPEENDEGSFYPHRSEIRDLYDAIAEGRTSDALKLLHTLCSEDISLLAPASQLRLRGRKAA